MGIGAIVIVVLTATMVALVFLLISVKKVLEVLVCFIFAVFGFIMMVLFALSANHPDAQCKVGIASGTTYKVYVVGERNGLVRVLLDNDEEIDPRYRDELSNTDCRLVPVKAFVTTPRYSVDQQTIEVVELNGKQIIRIVEAK